MEGYPAEGRGLAVAAAHGQPARAVGDRLEWHVAAGAFLGAQGPEYLPNAARRRKRLSSRPRATSSRSTGSTGSLRAILNGKPRGPRATKPSLTARAILSRRSRTGMLRPPRSSSATIPTPTIWCTRWREAKAPRPASSCHGRAKQGSPWCSRRVPKRLIQYQPGGGVRVPCAPPLGLFSGQDATR